MIFQEIEVRKILRLFLVGEIPVQFFLQLAGIGLAALVNGFYLGAAGLAQMKMLAVTAGLGEALAAVGKENLGSCIT